RSISRHYADFAGESCRAPIEAHLAFHLASNHALYGARAEALARGWFNGRAAVLSPAQDKPSVRLARPLDLNMPIGHRQGPVLRRVGCQFMQGHRNCLRSEEHTSELQSHSDRVCRL